MHSQRIDFVTFGKFGNDTKRIFDRTFNPYFWYPSLIISLHFFCCSCSTIVHFKWSCRCLDNTSSISLKWRIPMGILRRIACCPCQSTFGGALIPWDWDDWLILVQLFVYMRGEPIRYILHAFMLPMMRLVCYLWFILRISMLVILGYLIMNRCRGWILCNRNPLWESFFYLNLLFIFMLWIFFYILKTFQDEFAWKVAICECSRMRNCWGTFKWVPKLLRSHVS